MHYRAAALLISLLCCLQSGVQAGASLSVDLERLIAEANRSSLIPVIIKFSDQLDITEVRSAVSRELQHNPLALSDHQRSKRQKLLRSKLISGLKARASDPKASLSRLLRRYGVKTPIKSLWSINAMAVDLPVHLVDEVANLPGIERISVDMALTMNATGRVDVTAEPMWNLQDVQTDRLWRLGVTGEGVTVAIVDSGVDLNHPDLVESWRGGSNSWFDPYAQHDFPSDLEGHGTQALSLILGGDSSGYQIGMAPNAQWIAAKIFDDDNETSLSAIHLALQWLLDPDGDPTTDDAPDVVNNSWGFANTINECYQEFSEDIRLLKEAGIAVVFSAGNFGPSLETSVSPANDPASLSVGSVNQFQDVDTLSSRGPGACDGGVFPKLVAPGDLVFTADVLPIGYNVVSGTSFAAPHVSGAIALLKSAFPMATVSQIETALYDSAADLGTYSADDHFGYGLLDVSAAYDLLFSEIGSDSAGMFVFGEASYSVDETTDKLIIIVRRLGGSRGEASVEYETSDYLATAGRNGDYTATSGRLIFADGETQRSFDIPIHDDNLDEENESFDLILKNPSGDALIGSRSQASVTILDDDGTGSLSFGSVSYAVNESRESVQVSLHRSGGYEGTISVDLDVVDGTALVNSDYTLPESNRIHFADGVVTLDIEIPLVQDDLHEPNEQFSLVLSNISEGGKVTQPGSSTITILDDDPNLSISSIHMDAVNYSVRENSKEVQIKVSRSGNMDRESRVHYKTVNGSAKAGVDYTTREGTLYFRPRDSSKNIVVPIRNDGRYERESSFTVMLTDVDSGTRLAKPSATLVHIVDDDARPNVSLQSSGGSASNSLGASSSFSDSFLDAGETGGNNTPPAGGEEGRNVKRSSLQIFDLFLQGYAGTEDDALNTLKTLGGTLNPQVDQDNGHGVESGQGAKDTCEETTDSSGEGCTRKEQGPEATESTNEDRESNSENLNEPST